MPKLSIIVTAYNVAAYLGPCLDGIIGQTLEDIEVIVVDDGSTDGTGSSKCYFSIGSAAGRGDGTTGRRLFIVY